MGLKFISYQAWYYGIVLFNICSFHYNKFTFLFIRSVSSKPLQWLKIKLYKNQNSKSLFIFANKEWLTY